MKRFLFYSVCVFLCACSCGDGTMHGYRPVRGAWVYSIIQHNDSLYFSTLENGIFRFHPDHPEAVRRIGGFLRQPFRTLCFTKDKSLLASSYYAGVFRLSASSDSMIHVSWARYPAWAMRLDDQGHVWLACPQGVLRQQGDSLVRFCGVRDAHDVAFFGNQVAVAHMKGISLYNRGNGALVGEYAMGLVCWSVTSFGDSVLVGGGIQRCLIVRRESSTCHEIRFGPAGNILWATALDKSGTLHIATQRGLFSARLSDSAAVCSGFENVCCKTVFIDSKGRIWVGRFIRSPRRWLIF